MNRDNFIQCWMRRQLVFMIGYNILAIILYLLGIVSEEVIMSFVLITVVGRLLTIYSNRFVSNGFKRR